jgi:putative ABC transport system permease protein
VISVARKNLFGDPIRLVISVGGIGLSVFLMSLLLSNFRGWQVRVGGFVEKVPADVWVAREGTTDFLTAASLLPTDLSPRLEAQEGVKAVYPLIVRPMSFNVDGKDASVHLVGFDPQSGVGGPLKMERGQGLPGPGEMVVDAVFLKRTGLDVGDVLSASGKELRIVGVASGGNFVFSQVSFMSLDAARDLLGMPGFNTFYLLELTDPSQARQVVTAIESANPGLKAFTGAEFAAATRDRALGDIIPILAVILTLAFIVGAAVTGLTIYTATVEKSREYGILKAVGFTNRYLYGVVFQQSLIVGALGFLVGAGLNLIVGRMAENVVYQFVTLVRWQDTLAVFGVTLLMTVVAAYIPMRRLARIDPVAVFKG